jgi:predicted DNA-binding ArsR family transcriptional regulator
VQTGEDDLRRAVECLRMAHEVSDLTNKKVLLDMAQKWVKFAELEQAKKSNDNN